MAQNLCGTCALNNRRCPDNGSTAPGEIGYCPDYRHAAYCHNCTCCSAVWMVVGIQVANACTLAHTCFDHADPVRCEDYHYREELR